MKLYYAPGTCALACWISLEWAGADYQAIKANPASNDYKKVNPLGAVPALDIGGPRTMTQNDAILQYIASQYPKANLGADDNELAVFEFHETMAFLTGDFHPAFWPYFAPTRYTIKTDKDSIEAARRASFARIDRVMTHLDGLISKNGHVYQNRRSVADAYAFIMARWSNELEKSWRDYTHIKPFMETMMEDAAVQKVLEQSAAP